MPTIITPTFPRTGPAVVDPNSWFKISITSDTPITLAQVDLYVLFGEQVDSAYPESPDYYGATIDKNILTSLGTVQDPLLSGFERLGYWGGASFDFEPPADTRSTATQVSPTEIALDVRLDQPLGYLVEHLFRVRAPSAEQIMQFNIIPRPFYSPAIGDVQSAFEAAIHVPTFALTLPECYRMWQQVIAAFDDRDTILAARRITRMALQRELGFSDLVSESSQIQNGFRTLVFDEVTVPKPLIAIDQTLGTAALAAAKRCFVELASKKGIPREWWEPIQGALDFIRVDLTYRVRLAAQLVAVAARASLEGLV